MKEEKIYGEKATNEDDKNIIKKEINALTEKIDKIQAYRKACIRIIYEYPIIKEDYKKKMETKEKVKELNKNNVKH